ncbi:MAG: hypothetical protein MUE50_20345 [Pirellulaceae bacterium]|nr:hypothetical protein [Pirellulaceae bacterium]
MNSRERVLTTFAHHEPDRVPLWFGMSPEFRANAQRQLGVDDEGLLVRLGDDFRRVSATYAGPPIQLQAPDATYRTPFGVERHGLGYGQPIRMPLAHATLREIHDYAWPDPAWMDVSQIRSAALAYQREYAILGGDGRRLVAVLARRDRLAGHGRPVVQDARRAGAGGRAAAARGGLLFRGVAPHL